MARTGTADLPLHGGHVPRWLADCMTALGRVLEHDHFGDSSGITTSVVGALKRGLAPIEAELGIYVCGGRGKNSLATPQELARVGERTGLDGAALARSSRLVAKVDSAAVQDGFSLYLHGFFVTREGRWCVVQQGMNARSKSARRYHWVSEGVTSFTCAPHAAIEGQPIGDVVNLTAARAEAARRAQLELVLGGPDKVVAELRKLRPEAQPLLPHLVMPDHHEVTSRDVALTRLHAAIATAAARGPRDFQDVLETPGVGARTLLSLAMVAEVVHGAPYRFSDPARFSLAHGGKDGHPFPVPRRVYDRTIRVMRGAVDRARIGERDRLHAIRRLDEETCKVDHAARRGPTFDEFVDGERRKSAKYGGRSVGTPPPPSAPTSDASTAGSEGA